MNKFSERLKDLRIEKGLSAKFLSKKIGVSDMSIFRWENNLADIKSEQIIKLAQFFEVSTDYLLGLEN
jgi:transcriptional regulator with XRE-family HTH domain